jgi:hypothetical protein
MHTAGFGEAEQAGFVAAPSNLVGQVRRIAGVGPAYEVLKLVGDARAMIRVFESGEEVALKVADILRDPLTETIP